MSATVRGDLDEDRPDETDGLSIPHVHLRDPPPCRPLHAPSSESAGRLVGGSVPHHDVVVPGVPGGQWE